jgi:hypothetical protein
MSAHEPFLVPVVIDDTPDDDEGVPEKFPRCSGHGYAQWGDTARALDWLETAMGHSDPYLLKVRSCGHCSGSHDGAADTAQCRFGHHDDHLYCGDANLRTEQAPSASGLLASTSSNG